MKVLKRIEQRRNKRFYDIYLEVDKSTHRKILEEGNVKLGYSRGTAFDYVFVRRCFKCWGFNHVGNECTSAVVCFKCAEDHNALSCTSDIMQCNNCIVANKKFNLKLNINHWATDRECQCYIRILNLIKKRTEYEI